MPVQWTFVLSSPAQNIIFLIVHFFTLLVPIAQQPGQAVVLGHLSLCLWSVPCLNIEHLVTPAGVSGSEKAYATPTCEHYARYLVLAALLPVLNG